MNHIPKTSETFRPFSFAVVADFHLHEPERPGLDELVGLQRMLSGHQDVEFIVFLGDICWETSIEELKAQIDRFHQPTYFTYGNNDFRRIEEYETVFGPRNQVFTHGETAFVLFHNCRTTSNDHAGVCTEEQWNWVETSLRQLRESSTKHLFLAAHIPPPCHSGFHRGFFMSEVDTNRLNDLCSRYQVTASFFGHLHQDAVYHSKHSEIIVTPSLNWNFTITAGRKDSKKTEYTKTKGGYYRIVHVHENAIEHALYALRVKQ